MRRLQSRLQIQCQSNSTASHPCAVALLLVLPLAGHLSGAGKLSSPLGASAGPISRAQATLVTTTGAAAPAAAPAPRQAIRSRTESYPLTPERRALLNTIRYAEGTWRGGSSEGYRVIYGGKLFHGFSRHPEIVVVANYVSAAAGAYQFLPTTWKAAARELNLPDFSPASQDQAALHLVHRRGALKRFDQEGLSSEVLARLAPEWASLPSYHGGSVYGQPVHSPDALREFYQQDLGRQKQITPPRRAVALAAAA